MEKENILSKQLVVLTIHGVIENGDISMANIFKNILDSLRLTEEDDYDDYANEMEEKEYKRAEKAERKSSLKQPYQASFDTDTPVSVANNIMNEVKKDKPLRTERAGAGKVVPIRTSAKGFEVCIMKPITFEDSQDICDMLLSNRAAVINLEGIDVDLAQRIMDFISGSVYAINGKLHQISSYIFIISPETVDISGDYLNFIQSSGFEAPTLNKEF
ncbi:MAG: cell division protein SepF [Anaerocolumna sp.]